MKKKLLAICLVLLMVFTFAACGPDKENGVSAELTSYEEALEAAKGTTVTFYGWGGDEVLNKWIDQSLAKTLKDEYDITLERVPMNIEDILAQLSDEKQAGEEKGSIDMIWINGENFYSAKDNGLLYGPIHQPAPEYGQVCGYGGPRDRERLLYADRRLRSTVFQSPAGYDY